jgi:nucleotide-binding universal stress UspA family protein
MRRILVPLDGSGFGEIALPVAAAMAQRSDSELELVTVHTSVPHLDLSRGTEAAVDAGLRAREEAYLKGVAEQVRRRFEISVTATVLDGPTVSAIVRHTLTDPPRLIVMSTHGRAGASRFFLGSAADRLVRELHCPFLLVRPGARLTKDELPEAAHVLVPLDGSQLAESVIDEVARFFPPAMTAIHLLRVVVPIDLIPVALPVPLPPVSPEILDSQLAAARQYLDAVAPKLRRHGWTVHLEVVVDRSPSGAVLRYAEGHHCDAIALATRGLGGVPRLLFGSVADKVVRGAATPVLVVNPPAGGFSGVLSAELEAVGAEPAAIVEGRR